LSRQTTKVGKGGGTKFKQQKVTFEGVGQEVRPDRKNFGVFCKVRKGKEPKTGEVEYGRKIRVLRPTLGWRRGSKTYGARGQRRKKRKGVSSAFRGRGGQPWGTTGSLYAEHHSVDGPGAEEGKGEESPSRTRELKLTEEQREFPMGEEKDRSMEYERSQNTRGEKRLQRTDLGVKTVGGKGQQQNQLHLLSVLVFRKRAYQRKKKKICGKERDENHGGKDKGN